MAFRLGATLALFVLASGCANAFTDGRIENRCNSAIPSCGFSAGCVFTPDQYLHSNFPGGKRVIVRSDLEEARLSLRFELLEPVFPGTEIFVRAYSGGCSDFDEERVRDINLFDLAGDDQILEFELDVQGRGDHAVEFFSDMASDFHFVVDIDD